MTLKGLLTSKKILALGALLALPLFVALPGAARGGSEYDTSQDIELVTGDMDNIKVKNLTRISITDPDVADISDTKPDDVLVMAKKPGQTVFFIWDDYGKRTVIVRVVEEDMGLVKMRISKLLQKANIKGVNLEENALEGRVVVSGELEEEQRDLLEKILEPFDEKILNLIKEKVYTDQIQIDMQITELDTTDLAGLGLNWFNDTGQSAFKLLYSETAPVTDGSIGDFFKVGDFNRATAMLATVSAFVQEGKARVLSKPRLVVVSGKEASFLVGGEIPFLDTTLSASGGQQTTSTTFKEYGVNMTITPTIKNGKIEIDLSVDVSDPDGTVTSTNGQAFSTRTASTHLNLNDGQTIILAGLIKKNKSQEVKRLPFISKVPVIGMMFRAKTTNAKDTELVISLTPTILRDNQPANPKPTVQKASQEDESADSNSWAGNESSPMNAYAQVLQNQISSAVHYPYEAKENGWEGTVKLDLRILKDGTLANVAIQQSSGYDVFDQDALNTAKMLAPYPPFSSDMDNEDVEVVVPIVYSQKALPRTR